jgi:hypothetical protein
MTPPTSSQVAYELDEDFRQHLPLLLHAGCCCADHEEDLVAGHAQQLLTNLTYSMAHM